MKTIFITAIITVIAIIPIVARPHVSHVVIANPGENASTSIRLNWHTDIDYGDSHCHYTVADDSAWQNVKSLKSEQQLCTIFDSIYSKSPEGKDIYEQAQFMRNTVEINSLQPDTRYKYRVGTKECGIIRYFKTAPVDNNWTAVIISDFHAYAPLPDRTRSAMSMIDTLLSISNQNVDLILHVGDIIAWGGSYSFWRDLYANEPFKKYVWAGLNGNHDNMSRGYALQTNQFFANTNNNPQNGYAGEKGVCYHFTYGNTLFIMLNNESMKTDEGLAKAQKWVREVIAKNSARFIVVMEHYQWFYGTTGKTSQYERWCKFFDECGVDLAIAANNHIYARTNSIYAEKETDGTIGTVYIQTPSSDNERGQTLKERTDNLDIIKFRWSEGQNTVGALLLQATNDSLTITLHNRNGSIIDTVTVKAKERIDNL